MCIACTANITTGHDLDQISQNFGTHLTNSCAQMRSFHFPPSVDQNPVKNGAGCDEYEPFLCAPLHVMHKVHVHASRATLCMCSKLPHVHGHQGPPLHGLKAFPPLSMEKERTTCEAMTSFCGNPLYVACGACNLHQCSYG